MSNTLLSPATTRVRFWDGMEGDVDFSRVAARSLTVKGAAYQNPLRFLEIYTDACNASWGAGNAASRLTYRDVRERFFPRIDGRPVDIGPEIALPPFCWRDADIHRMCTNFSYNANAFYRIFFNLSVEGKIDAHEIGNLIDRACGLLASIYMAGDFRVIKNINNNFNMFLISRVVSEIVGAANYSMEAQELHVTQHALDLALKMAPACAALPTITKMGFALGMGVVFVEHQLRAGYEASRIVKKAEATIEPCTRGHLAIDDRDRLLRMISDGCSRRGGFVLTVVLDDATETVADLLWIQDLIGHFPHLRVDILVNTAQISINFSAHMLDAVLRSESFKFLASRLGTQFEVTKIYCPFISFQPEYLPVSVLRRIDNSHAVFVKGANFFETFQVPHKPCFYAFVVFGPVSRAYSGLNDHDAVFAYVPAGASGYRHGNPCEGMQTLRDVVENRTD